MRSRRRDLVGLAPWSAVVALVGAGLAPGGVLATSASASATPEAPTVSEVIVADVDEPGQPLRISGRVLDATSAAPVAGAAITVYQTDDGGEYEPRDPSDESTARLRGDLTTDDQGRFAFRTILPGEYPGQPLGNRHIHVHSVSAEGYEPTGFVILFDDNVRDEVRTWAASTGFGRVIETTLEAGLLRGSLEIELEPLAVESSPGA